MNIFLFFILVIAIMVIINYLFPRIQVCGESMYPTYKDGELLIGTRLYRKRHLKVGDVILYKIVTPEKTYVVIKRIADIQVSATGELLFYCLGDNSKYSCDSRYYGYVSEDRLVCKPFSQRRCEQ